MREREYARMRVSVKWKLCVFSTVTNGVTAIRILLVGCKDSSSFYLPFWQMKQVLLNTYQSWYLIEIHVLVRCISRGGYFLSSLSVTLIYHWHHLLKNLDYFFSFFPYLCLSFFFFSFTHTFMFLLRSKAFLSGSCVCARSLTIKNARDYLRKSRIIWFRRQVYPSRRHQLESLIDVQCSII